MKIENSVALVTGANRGIGAALVNALPGAGAPKVYKAARHEGDLRTVATRNTRRNRGSCMRTGRWMTKRSNASSPPYRRRPR